MTEQIPEKLPQFFIIEGCPAKLVYSSQSFPNVGDLILTVCELADRRPHLTVTAVRKKALSSCTCRLAESGLCPLLQQTQQTAVEK